MRSFKDTTGRQWTLAVTVASIKRVKALTGVDLMTVVERGGDLFMRLAADPVLLVDTIFALCKPDADQAGVTDEQFGAAMAGDAIDDAATALLDGITDFFPKARRTVLSQVATKIRAAETAAATRLVRAVADLDVAALIEREMAAAERELGLTPPAAGGPPTSSPGASASTPAPSPSAS